MIIYSVPNEVILNSMFLSRGAKGSDANNLDIIFSSAPGAENYKKGRRNPVYTPLINFPCSLYSPKKQKYKQRKHVKNLLPLVILQFI